MVTIKKLEKAILETEKFVLKAKEVRGRLIFDEYAKFGCKETGSIKRASMDLSKILIELRK